MNLNGRHDRVLLPCDVPRSMGERDGAERRAKNSGTMKHQC